MNTGENEDESGRMSQEQKIAMVEFMQENSDFAKRKFVGVEGKKTLDGLWEVLAVQLNNLPGPKKTAAKWKRSWCQLKSKTKSKVTSMKNTRSLNEFENKIINIVTPEVVYGIEPDVILDTGEPLPSSSSTPNANNSSPSFKEHNYFMSNDVTNDEDSDRCSSIHTPEPEDKTTPGNTENDIKRNALQHFMKGEDNMNETLKTMSSEMTENNKLLREANDIARQQLEERKKTNSLLMELITVFKNK